MALVWAVLGLLLIVSLTSRLVAYKRLSHFKGPLVAAFCRWFLIRAAWSGKQYLILHEAAKKYGNLARVAPNILMITDADTWKYVNGARTQYYKSDEYNVFKFDPRGHHVISETDPRKWKVLRQTLAHGYSGKEIGDVEVSIKGLFLKLADLLRSKASVHGDPKFTNVALLLHYFTFDFITKIDFGKAFGFLEADRDIFNYIEETTKFFPFIALCTAWPGLFHFMDHRWIRPLWEPVMFSKTRGIGALREWAKEEVITRYESGQKSQQDMLGSFMRHGMERFDAECNALLQVLAGSDTVASALTSAIFYITSDPEIHKKVYEEVRQNKMGKADDELISQAEARTLVYTQACIKETLRRASVVTGILERVVPGAGDSLAGRWVPGGTRVMVDTYGILHNESVFGSDTETFNPDRWIGKPEDDIKKMSSSLSIAFGSGKIDCMGRAIANMELDKVIPELIYRFDFVPKDPTNFNVLHHHVLVWHEFLASVHLRDTGRQA